MEKICVNCFVKVLELDIFMVYGFYLCTGILNFVVSPVTDENDVTCRVSVKARSGNVVSKSRNCSGSLLVPDAKLWWPFGSSHSPGYLYTLEVTVS